MRSGPCITKKLTLVWSPLIAALFSGPFRVLPYLPVYKSILCIGGPSTLEPKNKFFLFLGNNFFEKLIFYLRIFFQVCHGYTKN